MLEAMKVHINFLYFAQISKTTEYSPKAEQLEINPAVYSSF